MSITINDLRKLKARKEKIACLTAYDATFATMISEAGIEVVLVGDSLGMVLQGQSSTLPVTIEHMIYHTQSVARANISSLIMADMPFMGCRSLDQCLDYSTSLMQAGAHMVKLEGGSWLSEMIQILGRNGVPVCAHLGLTPQSVHKFGGFKVQGKEEKAASELIEDAKALEQSGAALLLVECIPAPLTKKIMQAVSIPVIGIGCGPDTDGQILVMHDAIGAVLGKPAKFVKNFMQGNTSISAAFKDYVNEVKSGTYPGPEHSFKI